MTVNITLSSWKWLEIQDWWQKQWKNTRVIEMSLLKKNFFFLKEWPIQASSHGELSLSKWTHRRNPQFSRTEWVPWGISAKWQVSLVLIGPNGHPFPPRGYILLPATQQSSQRCEIFCWLWKIWDIISQWVPVNPVNLMAGHRERSLAPGKTQFPGLRFLRSRQRTVTPNFPVTDLSKSISFCKRFWWLPTCFHISTSCFLQVSHFALLSLFKNLWQNASWARLSADSLLCRGLPATTVLSGDVAWLPNGPPCPGLVLQTMLLAACPSGPAPLSALVTPLCPGLSVWQKEFAQLRTSSFFLQNAQNLGDNSKDFYLLNPHRPPHQDTEHFQPPQQAPSRPLCHTPSPIHSGSKHTTVTFITEHWFLASLDLHLWNCSVLWSWKYISLISDCGDWPTADSAGLWNPSSPCPWEDTLPTGCSSLWLGVEGTWVQPIPGR